MISRYIEKQLLSYLVPGKVVVILGARRTGKTILLENLKNQMTDKKVLFVQGDNLDVADILSQKRAHTLKRFVEGYNVLIIDEAQTIPHIGESLKLLIDTTPTLSIIVSGSSSFDLRNKIGEPLTGRNYTFHLFPLSHQELKTSENYLQTRERLEERLLYGSYPQVITAVSLDQKQKELESIRDGYLLKDILALDNLKNSLFVFNLLRLIAFQIGNDISYSELATQLGVNKKTVMRYLELLEKTFVLFSLSGFSRNLRKEYTKTPRYYFWDIGIRNVLIANFNSLNLRDDVGKLWENYVIAERIKKTSYTNTLCNRYFWRTYDQQEIDFIEEQGGNLSAFECKWSPNPTKPPRDFLRAYPTASYTVISRNTYEEYI